MWSVTYFLRLAALCDPTLSDPALSDPVLFDPVGFATAGPCLTSKRYRPASVGMIEPTPSLLR